MITSMGNRGPAIPIQIADIGALLPRWGRGYGRHYGRFDKPKCFKLRQIAFPLRGGPEVCCGEDLQFFELRTSDGQPKS
jgi:hypothetical protein